MRILMVCMGNICRSPTAEAVLRAKLEAAGLADRVEVDSAGTHDYHVGAPPDPRAQEHGALRGYDLTRLRARKVGPADFERFDLVLAMDEDNLATLQRRCPPAQRHKLEPLMRYAPDLGTQVPDPYYGGASGFDQVLDLVEAACDGLVQRLSGASERP